MKYLKIQNQGILDIRLVALMGGTTKTGDKYKIGQFGTGLKYVLAYLFRNDIGFKIYVGGKQVKITLEHETIKDEQFDIICIEGNRTSITTRMGLDWEPWMIIREIYSNALDEGGASYGMVERCVGKKEATTFYIEASPEILKVYNNWSKYFIVGNEPMFENESFAVHPSGESLKIYKHGILIHENKDKKSIFNYDIKNAKINELRQYQGVASQDIYRCICNLDKRSIEYFLENCKEEMYEGGMDYDWDFMGTGQFVKDWEETIGSAKIIHQKAVDDIEARGLDIDLSSVLIVPKKVYKALTKKFEGIGALRVAKSIGDFYEIHNEELKHKIDRCIDILNQIGYFMEPELKYIIGVFGDTHILARVNTDSKEIWISEKHADKSMFDTCSMLIEENEHFSTGFQDHSREFQQHFIDLYTSTLLSKAGVEL